MDSSEFLIFLQDRASVREFRDFPLADDEIAYMLACARTAPTAGNLESWDLVLVTDPEQRASLAEAAHDQTQIVQAGAIFVVCSNYVRGMARFQERGILYALEDATIVCTYLMLAAHVLHLQSCWTGSFDDEDVRTVLDLPPHLRPVALLAVGNGAKGGVSPERRPVDEHVHQDFW
jgi:nitroreductase